MILVVLLCVPTCKHEPEKETLVTKSMDGIYVKTVTYGERLLNLETYIVNGNELSIWHWVPETETENGFNTSSQVLYETVNIIRSDPVFIDEHNTVWKMTTDETGTWLTSGNEKYQKVLPGKTGLSTETRDYYFSESGASIYMNEIDLRLYGRTSDGSPFAMSFDRNDSGNNITSYCFGNYIFITGWSLSFTGCITVNNDKVIVRIDGIDENQKNAIEGIYNRYIRSTPWPVAK